MLALHEPDAGKGEGTAGLEILAVAKQVRVRTSGSKNGVPGVRQCGVHFAWVRDIEDVRGHKAACVGGMRAWRQESAAGWRESHSMEAPGRGEVQIRKVEGLERRKHAP